MSPKTETAATSNREKLLKEKIYWYHKTEVRGVMRYFVAVLRDDIKFDEVDKEGLPFIDLELLSQLDSIGFFFHAVTGYKDSGKSARKALQTGRINRHSLVQDFSTHQVFDVSTFEEAKIGNPEEILAILEAELAEVSPHQ